MSDTGTTLGNLYEAPGWLSEILMKHYRLMITETDIDAGSMIENIELEISSKLCTIHTKKVQTQLAFDAYKAMINRVKEALDKFN